MTIKKNNKKTAAPLKVIKGAKAKVKTKAVTPSYTFLDLGCGENKSSVQSLFENGLITVEQKDFSQVIGVDSQKVAGVDKVHDLTKFPYPFKDNSIDGAFSSHFLEHLDGEQRIKFFNEMYRILKPGAKMKHVHPYYKSSRAVQDPTHKFPSICEDSYLYWNKGWRDMNKLGHYLGDCNFEVESMVYTFMDQSWLTKNPEQRDYAIKHYFNVVADLIVVQVKK